MATIVDLYTLARTRPTARGPAGEGERRVYERSEYERKVREIALLQCRCQSGTDLESDRPKHDDEEPEHPDAA